MMFLFLSLQRQLGLIPTQIEGPDQHIDYGIRVLISIIVSRFTCVAYSFIFHAKRVSLEMQTAGNEWKRSSERASGIKQP